MTDRLLQPNRYLPLPVQVGQTVTQVDTEIAYEGNFELATGVTARLTGSGSTSAIYGSSTVAASFRFLGNHATTEAAPASISGQNGTISLPTGTSGTTAVGGGVVTSGATGNTSISGGTINITPVSGGTTRLSNSSQSTTTTTTSSVTTTSLPAPLGTTGTPTIPD